MPRPSIWPINKMQPFTYQPHRRQCTASGLLHPAWWSWGEKNTWGLKALQLTCSYQEVQKEKTVTLDIIQWHAIWARAPPDTFCGAVQELHWHLALVIEENNWPNMEEEIWEGVMNDPVVAASPRPLMPGGTLPQTPLAEKPMAAIPPSASEPEGMMTPEDLALVPRRQPPQGFLPRTWKTSSYQPYRLARVTLLNTSNQEYQGPSLRDKEAWAIITLHPILRTPKYKLKQIPTLPMKWTVDQANIHSPNEVTW